MSHWACHLFQRDKYLYLSSGDVLGAGVPVYFCIQIKCRGNTLKWKRSILSVIDNLHISISHVFCIMRLNIHLTKTIVKILTPEISKEFQLITSANLYSKIPPIKLHQTVIFIKSLGHILLHVQKEECNHEYTRDTNFNVETQVGKNPRWHEAKFTI